MESLRENKKASYLSLVGGADIEVTQNGLDSHFIVQPLISAAIIS